MNYTLYLNEMATPTAAGVMIGDMVAVAKLYVNTERAIVSVKEANGYQWITFQDTIGKILIRVENDAYIPAAYFGVK